LFEILLRHWLHIKEGEAEYTARGKRRAQIQGILEASGYV